MMNESPSSVQILPPTSALLTGKAPLDASSGFHDIKPAPEFSPIPITALAIASILLIIGFILWRLYQRQFRERVTFSTPSVAPHIIALEELRGLEKARGTHSISAKQLATRASLSLRGYLESVGVRNAKESTHTELVRFFDTCDSPYFVESIACEGEPVKQKLINVLSFFDSLSFSEFTRRQFPLEHSRIASSLQSSIAIIQTLESVTPEDTEDGET